MEAVVNEWMNSIEKKMKNSNFDSFKGLFDKSEKEFRFQFLSIEDYYFAESEMSLEEPNTPKYLNFFV